MAADDFTNVLISVLKDFETAFASTYAIHLPHDAKFDTQAEDLWLEPRLLGPTSSPSRSSDRVEGWTLNVNCYARVDGDRQGIYAPTDLVGAVADRYRAYTLDVQDWDAAGDPTVAYLRFAEPDANPVPTPSGQPEARQNLVQWNVSVAATLIV